MKKIKGEVCSKILHIINPSGETCKVISPFMKVTVIKVVLLLKQALEARA